jgi:hypothetical protein
MLDRRRILFWRMDDIRTNNAKLHPWVPGSHPKTHANIRTTLGPSLTLSRASFSRVMGPNTSVRPSPTTATIQP